MKPLFVYGTLQPGRENSHILNNIGGKWLAATVRGIYYPKGWGAAADFPGIEISGDGPLVPGYLFFSDQLAAHWRELDAFEEGYDRISVSATTQEGQSFDAWVYQLQPRRGDYSEQI